MEADGRGERNLIHLVLSLKSPFIISENHTENLLGSKDYISGSVIRGALAHTFLRYKHKNDTKLFREFFLSGKVRFGNCYFGTETVSVLPATARSCKGFPDFSQDETDEDDPKHGVLDGLIRYYTYHESLLQEKENNECLIPLDICEKCGSPVERFKGFYGTEADRYKRFTSDRAVITRTAIDEYTLTAKKGSLFSTELVLPPEKDDSLYYHGRIFVTDYEIEKKLADFLTNDIFFTIGGERTYGYGQVEVNEAIVSEKPVFPENDIIEERLDSFNNKLQDFLPDKEEDYFVLTLNSDAILMDKFLRYISPLDEKILYNYFPSDLQFELVESYCSTQIVQGWSNVHKLPKEKDIAIAKSSVFLFKTEKETDRKKLIDYLNTIEFRGIGERKAEGFGEIIVCHPFHLEVEPV